MRWLLGAAWLIIALLWLSLVSAAAMDLPDHKCVVNLGKYESYSQALDVAQEFLPYHRYTEIYEGKSDGYYVTLGLLERAETRGYFASQTQGPMFPRTVTCSDGSELGKQRFPVSESSETREPSPSEVFRFAGENLVATLILMGLFFFGGKVLGKLTVNVGFLKFIALLFVGIWLYENLSGVRTLFAASFFVGVLSNHLDWWDLSYHFSRLWGGAGGGMVSLYKARSENARLKQKIRELEEELDRMRESRQRHEGSAGSSQQQSWKEEARSSRSKTSGGSQKSSSGTGGSSQQQSRSSSSSSTEDSLSRSRRERHLRALGLDPSGTYSKQDIKKAFRKMAMKHHPDTGGDPVTFMVVKEAYDWLMENP